MQVKTTITEFELKENGILTITFNRPDKLNALNEMVLEELEQLFLAASNDPAVKAVLITGKGKSFCAGADIKWLATLDAQNGMKFALLGQRVFRLLETMGKPSLAVINGYAFGGGCELAMAATLRIANENAQFGQPEINLGVIPGFGGTQRLARLVGKGRALELCLTGRTFNAKDAFAWGFISDITTAELLMEKANSLLQTIISKAPIAAKSIMEVIDKGYDLPLPNALHLEAAHFGLTCSTEDKTIGVNAFLNKEKPQFKNN